MSGLRTVERLEQELPVSYGLVADGRAARAGVAAMIEHLLRLRLLQRVLRQE